MDSVIPGIVDHTKIGKNMLILSQDALVGEIQYLTKIPPKAIIAQIPIFFELTYVVFMSRSSYVK
jgi:hypothetical protein